MDEKNLTPQEENNAPEETTEQENEAFEQKTEAAEQETETTTTPNKFMELLKNKERGAAGDCPWRVKSWELLGVMQSLRHVPKLPVPPPWRVYYP